MKRLWHNGIKNILSCPLIEAVKNNDEYCVNVLLGTKDINVNSQDSAFSSEHRFWRGATALHYAAVQKSQTMVTRLLAADADPTIKNTTGETPRDLTPWKDTDYILERWESLTPEERDRKINHDKYAAQKRRNAIPIRELYEMGAFCPDTQPPIQTHLACNTKCETQQPGTE